jgi:hypothetical protein
VRSAAARCWPRTFLPCVDNLMIVFLAFPCAADAYLLAAAEAAAACLFQCITQAGEITGSTLLAKDFAAIRPWPNDGIACTPLCSRLIPSRCCCCLSVSPHP